MSAQIRHIDDVAAYMFSGRATATLVNDASGGRFTFEFTQPKRERDNPHAPTFVHVLTGPDNESDFEFMGTIFRNAAGPIFRGSTKSRIGEDAQSRRVVNWLVGHIVEGKELPASVRFMHDGRCGRCGRKLTVPESIETGLGPVCAGK